MERAKPDLRLIRPPDGLLPNDDALEDDPNPIAGWVIVRATSQTGREFWCEDHGRWYRSKVHYEKGGVLVSRFPDATTVYDDEDAARRIASQVDPTGLAVLAAVPRRLEHEERLANDRTARSPAGLF